MEGTRFDPHRIEGIRHMQQPTNGAHLQQFVRTMQWMRNAIPDFSSIVPPLSEMLEKVYTKDGKRTKTSEARISLSSIGWGRNEYESFDRCKTALENQVTLAHRDEAQRLCAYTDASDLFWSGVVTQVPVEDLLKLHVDHRHQPLCFFSSHFSGSQLCWSTLKKEAYAIMETVERRHWLLATTNVSTYSQFTTTWSFF